MMREKKKQDETKVEERKEVDKETRRDEEDREEPKRSFNLISKMIKITLEYYAKELKLSPDRSFLFCSSSFSCSFRFETSKCFPPWPQRQSVTIQHCMWTAVGCGGLLQELRVVSTPQYGQDQG